VKCLTTSEPQILILKLSETDHLPLSKPLCSDACLRRLPPNLWQVPVIRSSWSAVLPEILYSFTELKCCCPYAQFGATLTRPAESGDIVPSILNFGTKWKWVAYSRSGCLEPDDIASDTDCSGGYVGPTAKLSRLPKKRDTASQPTHHTQRNGLLKLTTITTCFVDKRNS